MYCDLEPKLVFGELNLIQYNPKLKTTKINELQNDQTVEYCAEMTHNKLLLHKATWKNNHKYDVE